MTSGFSDPYAGTKCLAPLAEVEWRARSELRRRTMADSLVNPGQRATAEQLAGMFEIDKVTVTARRPTDMQDYPELAVRVRGAFGRVLHRMGPPVFGRKDYGARPRAWDILFEPMGNISARAEIPKPFTVQAEVRGEKLTASILLFGMAGFWNPDAAAALVGALEGGITLWDQGRTKVSLQCLDVVHTRIAGFEPLNMQIREARLHFRTPVLVRAANAAVLSPASLTMSLINRVANLAVWQGVRLDADWRALHGLARRIDYDTGGLVPFAWTRGTQRARGRIPVLGSLGTLVLRGDIDPLIPFLQIGEAAHTGSHASIGLGRYELALLP